MAFVASVAPVAFSNGIWVYFMYKAPCCWWSCRSWQTALTSMSKICSRARWSWSVICLSVALTLWMVMIHATSHKNAEIKQTNKPSTNMFVTWCIQAFQDPHVFCIYRWTWGGWGIKKFCPYKNRRTFFFKSFRTISDKIYTRDLQTNAPVLKVCKFHKCHFDNRDAQWKPELCFRGTNKRWQLRFVILNLSKEQTWKMIAFSGGGRTMLPPCL